jgi:hypothetical protein
VTEARFLLVLETKTGYMRQMSAFSAQSGDGYLCSPVDGSGRTWGCWTADNAQTFWLRTYLPITMAGYQQPVPTR